MNVCTVHEIISKNSVKLSAKPADNSFNSAELSISEFFLFLAWLNFVSAEFSQFSLNFLYM
jgi:hypothetical protein